jgi:transcriptional regulator with XRE-family HTH domain
MSREKPVNESVRQKLRQLRLSKKLGIKQAAYVAGIPFSSYACMEAGHYKINLDDLSRILGALGADISEVWPDIVPNVPNQSAIRRIQEFRLSEVVALCPADGAALFSVTNAKCRVHMSHNVSDYFLDRLALYLEAGKKFDDGLWFEKAMRDTRFLFFLKSGECPPYLRKLVEQYLIIWSHIFTYTLTENVVSR